MGGFTTIQLKTEDTELIRYYNDLLHNEFEVSDFISIYSKDNIVAEYTAFLKGDVHFPEDQFPKDKIRDFTDFRKYWSTKALGATFCPPFGTLSFDCYFGRTSKEDMTGIALFLNAFSDEVKNVSGSSTTFIEKLEEHLDKPIFEKLLNLNKELYDI